MAGLKGKKILITGGSGFIGSNLAYALDKLGADVIASDIAVDPHSFFIQNKLHRRINFEISDVRNKEDVNYLFSKYQPEFVYHLAAQTLVTTAYTNPAETLETNINGTINILEAVRRSQSVKAIVVASSDKAYGKTEKKYNENFPLKGDHPYDVSKSSADLICNAYHKTYGTPVIVTRFGNVFGEGDLHFNRIIPGMCRSIILNEVLEVRSDGTFVRDYLYVKDVVEGYIFLIKNFSRAVGEAYNFSSKTTFSVIDLIKEVEKVLNLKVKYTILNNSNNEIPYQHLNDNKIRKLGWKSDYQFSDSIKGTLEWYRKAL